MKYAFLITTFLIGAGLSACAPHNIDEKPLPNINVPETFPTDTQNTQFPEELQNPWWQSFERPLLNDLVAQSLSANQDIAAAIARVKQARALSRITGADRFPLINAEGSYTQDWEGSDEGRATGDIGAALSWEIDIFNRIGSAALADRLQTNAREEDVKALQLSISAEVASAYFGATAANLRLKLLREQLKLDKELLGLLQLRLENGVGTNVDVLQQRARVADSETLIPRAESDLAVFENRLDVLLGQSPDAQKRIPASETLAFRDDLPPIGIPAALLLNRPDLRFAKAELVAADADIASAIAERLPRITLDGSYAYSDAASYTGPVALLTGMFVQPLLDWGKRKAEVERNKALYEERLAAYTQLFLTAVEDVENALVQEKKQREFILRLEKQRNILQETANASEDRYTQGIDDYLPVINALQELRQVERDLIAERLALVNIRIALFRAIGGPL